MLNQSGAATWLQQLRLHSACWLGSTAVAHFDSRQGEEHMDIPDFLEHAAYRANVMLVCVCVCV